jgi:6-phospho-beta-glucosidase
MYEAVHDARAFLAVDELVLYDTDRSRLDRVHPILQGIDQERGTTIVTRVTDDVDDAVDGADFVYSAVRVGGLKSRIVDEVVPLRYGVVGQETTGPGGISFALRTIPPMLEIAEVVARRAPRAWFMNFTNPAGMITEALTAVLGDRVFGICDTPRGMFRRIAHLLGRQPSDLWFDYAGLNHLGWLREIRDGNDDLLPALLADDALLAGLEEGHVFGADWLRELGMIPNEYLAYYYGHAEVVENLRRAGRTRGEYLLEQQEAYLATRAATPAEAVALWRETTRERSSTYMLEAGAVAADGTRPGIDPDDLEGYAGVALRAAGAIVNNDPAVMVMNARNRSALGFLDADAVVETSCVVSGAGVHPVAAGVLPDHARALVESMKAVERLTIEAARTGSAELAIRALALHPLVPSVGVARSIFAGYRAEEPHIRARFS